MTGADSDRVAAIKRSLDPARLISGLGITARQSGREYLIRCMWHDDSDPSCSIRLTHGETSVRCYSCGAVGDSLSLVAKVRGLDPRTDFVRVLEEAEALVGMAQTTPRSHQLSTPEISDGDFADLARELLRLAPITGQPDVTEYVRSRGIEPLATSWGALPASAADRSRLRDRLAAAVGEAVWLGSGLAKSDGEWSWPNHRLVIPWRVRGVDGEVLSLQRRSLGDERPKYVAANGRKFLEPFGIEDAIEELGEGVAIAFVEGAIDTLSYRILASRGLTRRGYARPRPEIGPTYSDSASALDDSADLVAVVGLPGVGGWRPEWAELARGRTAIIALDADRAGEDAVARISDDVFKAAAEVIRDCPKGKDWNDVLRGVSP
ncbi:MAG: toprim domain-containing protein [Deltaproteobacteria bacterium]|nr:toprim domain-containing protein [Deltaproteobacteria bacterium]